MFRKTRVLLPARRLFVLALLFGVSTAGCRDATDGPTRYNVSGKVTFDGQPIPDGMIVFEHGETKIATACPIKNGYYENESDKGHLGGKYTVSVSGYASEPVAGLPGPELFQGRWVKEIDLPAESTSMDFDVPKSEVKEAAPATGDPGDQT